MRVVDSHTCGQPTRVIMDGTGIKSGTAPLDAQTELREQRDWIRRLAVLEPRGHRSMFAAALIAPATRKEDYGVVYMDAYGYPDMCGHATIGVATTLFVEGLITPPTPNFSGPFEFGLLTPAGRIGLRARVEAGRVLSIAFRTPLAFYLGSMEIELNGLTKMVDIAYGGQWYGFIDLTDTGLQVDPNDIDALLMLGAKARLEIERHIQMKNPIIGGLLKDINVVWVDTPRHPSANARNVPISPAGSFDRSPCGTATCARMATLVAKGRLKIGETFTNESLLGTHYYGKAISEIIYEGIPAIVPEVAGSAWITSRAELHLDPQDPLGSGYLVGGGPAIL